ncbi:MAG: ribonuclease HII [Methanomassiliicoccaceae archaeon]|nr:ribonuclease HII [Methanomassiliicoccaceae archaeon]
MNIMFFVITENMRCGVDEAGRGSVLGPMAVAAVFTDSEENLKKIGVKDSKKLSPKTREHMFDLIVEECKVSIVLISASDIDAKRKSISLNEIELEMFAEACSKYPSSIVYADCPDVNETGFSNDMKRLMKGTEIIAKHKADDLYPIVSAASIIAKVTRDRAIEDIQKEFGKEIGSGYPSDEITMNFIEKWIKDNGCAPPYTRCSWEPVRQMLTISKNKKISDW